MFLRGGIGSVELRVERSVAGKREGWVRGWVTEGAVNKCVWRSGSDSKDLHFTPWFYVSSNLLNSFPEQHTWEVIKREALRELLRVLFPSRHYLFIPFLRTIFKWLEKKVIRRKVVGTTILIKKNKMLARKTARLRISYKNFFRAVNQRNKR